MINRLPLGCNFYKSVTGDAGNMLLAETAYNFKRAMKALLYLIKNSVNFCTMLSSTVESDFLRDD